MSILIRDSGITTLPCHVSESLSTRQIILCLDICPSIPAMARPTRPRRMPSNSPHCSKSSGLAQDLGFVSDVSRCEKVTTRARSIPYWSVLCCVRPR